VAKQRVPGKYKGGAAQWEAHLAADMQRERRTLEELMAPGMADSPMRAGAIMETHFQLGLFCHWLGAPEATEHFRKAALGALVSVERALPALTSGRAPDLTLPARDGAIAAALAGDHALAETLFGHTVRLAAGLVPGAEQPGELTAGLDPMGAFPLARAYSMIRLGQFAGFGAVLYPVPLPEARKARPVWAPEADIGAQLDAAEICWELGKGSRGKDWAAEKWLFPMLRALVASLASGGEAERSAANKALATYYGKITGRADFRSIYPLVLDLQAAYPHIFERVV
jgi:hypothetical protein